MEEYSASPYSLASKKICLKCRCSLERREQFHFEWLRVHEKLFSLQLFYYLQSRNYRGSYNHSFFQARNGARWSREQMWGWDSNGERYGSLGAGCLSSLPLVQMQRPRTQKIHTVRTCQHSSSCFTKGNRSLCSSLGCGASGGPSIRWQRREAHQEQTQLS